MGDSRVMTGMSTVLDTLDVLKTYKVALVGESRTGKSAITCQYLFNKFQNQYIATVEDFYSARVKIQEYTYEIDILDTAGDDDYKSIRDSSFKNRDGFVFVYDFSKRDTLK